jgi:methylase of polypeptide subunit release factors
MGRPETESMTTHLAELVKHDELHEAITYKRRAANDPEAPKAVLRVLDLCSGSGCISLLLASLLGPPIASPQLQVEVCGLDISPDAVSLANQNLKRNIDRGHLHGNVESNVHTSFRKADIFDPQELALHADGHFDIIISNPPYVSASEYLSPVVTRSVRNWEPKNALMPNSNMDIRWPKVLAGNIFYRQLLEFHGSPSPGKLSSNVLIMEVGSKVQAIGVIMMVHELYGNSKYIELWCDHHSSHDSRQSYTRIFETVYPSRGEGSIRAVVIYDLEWAKNSPSLAQGLKCHGPNITHAAYEEQCKLNVQNSVYEILPVLKNM